MIFKPLKKSQKYVGVSHKDNELVILCLDNETITFSNIEKSVFDNLLNSREPDTLIQNLINTKTFKDSTEPF